MTRHTRSTSFYTFATVLASIVAIALLCVVAEVGVRVRHYAKYGDFWGIEDTYTTDAATGLRTPIPNGRFGGISINSLGFRGPEIAMPKPPHTTRIAFLGASTTYCAEVTNNEATWPDLVVRALGTRWQDARLDYVNAGVPGFTVADSEVDLTARVAELEPDVVVIYHATNDLSQNSATLAREAGLLAAPTEQQLHWPAKYSLLWYLVEKNLRVIGQRDLEQSTNALSYDPETLAIPFRRDLLSLVETSKRIAPDVVLMTFATQLRREQAPDEQAKAAVTARYYMPYMSVAGLVDGYESYNRVIRDVAATTGVQLIEAEREVPGDTAHFFDSVHLTDLGSKVLADRVTDGLASSDTFIALLTARQAQLATGSGP